MTYVIACVPDDADARAEISKLTGIPCVPYQNSVAGTCAGCQCAVWVGPAQAAKREELLTAGEAVATLCLPCAARSTIDSPPAKVMALTKKQWGE